MGRQKGKSMVGPPKVQAPALENESVAGVLKRGIRVRVVELGSFVTVF